MNCPKGGVRCSHVQEIALEYEGIVVENQPRSTETAEIRGLDGLISKEHYPLDLHQDLDLGHHIRLRAKMGFQWYYTQYPDFQLAPEITQCECGCTDFVSSQAKHHPRHTKIHAMGIFNEDEFSIMKKTCSECQKVFFFDGRAVGLLNFRNYIIFPGTKWTNRS